MKLEILFEEIKKLVYDTGDYLKNAFYSAPQVFHKTELDLVTTADLEAEKRLKTGLETISGLPVLAEESYSKENKVPKEYWLVDPLDGTINFAHKIPWFAISVALMQETQPILGIIYNPITEEFFYAIKEKGAYLNDKPIKTSSKKELSEALLCTGFPIKYVMNKAYAFLPPFQEFLKRCQGVRRFGSACLDLAYVACGKYEAFWEPYLNPWDTAAGMLIVLEAGGKVTDYFGNPYNPYKDTIVASNGLIHEEIIKITSKYYPENVKPFRNPLPTVDIIIEYEEKIVLIYRKNYPQGWALPGGFIEYGETAEQAAIREAKEETNLDIDLLYLLGCYSDPKRDPRFHTITVVYVAKGKGIPKAKDDAKDVGLFKINEIPWNELVFDHAQILKDYLKRIKKGKNKC